MKAATYHGKKDIRIEEVPTPNIEDDEILVEMKACGVCGSDLMEWYLEAKAPLVLGHEPSGLVAKKGKEVKDFSVGERVFVHHHVACLTCHYCRNGDFTMCERFHKTNIKPGGLAQYFKVPAFNLQTDTLRIPDSMSFEEASLIEPLACCLRAVRKCNMQVGDSVAIMGAGATGLIHTALSKIYGVTTTIVTDLFEFRLDMARRFGADFVVNPREKDPVEVAKAETNGRGVDMAIVTAPSVKAYEDAINVCRKGGRVCVFAPTAPKEQLQICPEKLFFTEVQLIPSYSASHL